jgi:hypothetical protein
MDYTISEVLHKDETPLDKIKELEYGDHYIMTDVKQKVYLEIKEHIRTLNRTNTKQLRLEVYKQEKSIKRLKIYYAQS